MPIYVQHKEGLFPTYPTLKQRRYVIQIVGNEQQLLYEDGEIEPYSVLIENTLHQVRRGDWVIVNEVKWPQKFYKPEGLVVSGTHDGDQTALILLQVESNRFQFFDDTNRWHNQTIHCMSGSISQAEIQKYLGNEFKIESIRENGTIEIK